MPTEQISDDDFIKLVSEGRKSGGDTLDDTESSFLSSVEVKRDPSQEPISFGDMAQVLREFGEVARVDALPKQGMGAVDLKSPEFDGLTQDQILDRVENRHKQFDDPVNARKIWYEERVAPRMGQIFPHIKTKGDVDVLMEQMKIARARGLLASRISKVDAIRSEVFSGEGESQGIPENLTGFDVGGRYRPREGSYHIKTAEDAERFLNENREADKAYQDQQEKPVGGFAGAIGIAAGKVANAAALGIPFDEEEQLFLEDQAQRHLKAIGVSNETIRNAISGTLDFAGAGVSLGPLTKAFGVGVTRAATGRLGEAAAKNLATKLAPALAMAAYATPDAVESGEYDLIWQSAGFGALAPAVAKRIRAQLAKMPPRLANSFAESLSFAITGHVIHGGRIDDEGADLLIGAFVGFASGGARSRQARVHRKIKGIEKAGKERVVAEKQASEQLAAAEKAANLAEKLAAKQAHLEAAVDKAKTPAEIYKAGRDLLEFRREEALHDVEAGVSGAKKKARELRKRAKELRKEAILADKTADPMKALDKKQTSLVKPIKQAEAILEKSKKTGEPLTKKERAKVENAAELKKNKSVKGALDRLEKIQAIQARESAPERMRVARAKLRAIATGRDPKGVVRRAELREEVRSLAKSMRNKEAAGSGVGTDVNPITGVSPMERMRLRFQSRHAETQIERDNATQRMLEVESVANEALNRKSLPKGAEIPSLERESLETIEIIRGQLGGPAVKEQATRRIMGKTGMERVKSAKAAQRILDSASLDNISPKDVRAAIKELSDPKVMRAVANHDRIQKEMGSRPPEGLHPDTLMDPIIRRASSEAGFFDFGGALDVAKKASLGTLRGTKTLVEGVFGGTYDIAREWTGSLVGRLAAANKPVADRAFMLAIKSIDTSKKVSGEWAREYDALIEYAGALKSDGSPRENLGRIRAMSSLAKLVWNKEGTFARSRLHDLVEGRVKPRNDFEKEVRKRIRKWNRARAKAYSKAGAKRKLADGGIIDYVDVTGGKAMLQSLDPDFFHMLKNSTPSHIQTLTNAYAEINKISVKEASKRITELITDFNNGGGHAAAEAIMGIERQRMGRMPAAIRVNGEEFRILRTSPAEWAQGVQRRDSARIGFITHFGQDFADKKVSKLRKRLAKEGTESTVLDDVILALHDISPFRPRFGPGREASAVVTRGVRHSIGLWKTAMLSGSAVINVPENLGNIRGGAGSRAFLGVLKDSIPMTAKKAVLYQHLENIGALTPDILNWTNRGGRTPEQWVRNVKNSMSSVTMYRKMGENQEFQAGLAAMRKVEQMKTGRRFGENYSDLISAGMSAKDAFRLASGGGTKGEYNKTIRQFVSKWVGANLSKSERSRWELTPGTKALTAFDTYAQAIWRDSITKTRALTVAWGSTYGKASKSMTAKQRWKIRLGATKNYADFLAGKAVQGTTAQLLSAWLAGDGEYAWNEFADDWGNKMVDGALTSMFAGTFGNMIKGIEGDREIVESLFPVYAGQIVLGAIFGIGRRWEGLNGSERAAQFLKMSLPVRKYLHNGMVFAGFADADLAERDRVVRAFYRWKIKEFGRSSLKRVSGDDAGVLSDIEAHEEMREHINRGVRLWRAGEPPEEYTPHFKKAAEVRGKGPGSVSRSLTGKRLLTFTVSGVSKETIQRKLQEFRELHGEEAWRVLERYDVDLKNLYQIR